MTLLQQRTAPKPETSQTGPERDPFPISLASAAALDEAASAQAVTVPSTQHLTPVASGANVAAHLHSRATASPVTLATGSAEDLFRQPLLLLPAKVAAHEVALKEDHVRDAGSPQPGVRVRAPKALVGRAVSSRSDHSTRDSPLLQTPTTSGGPRCALTHLLSSHPHLHPMLAHHHRQRRSLLRQPVVPA